MNSRLQALYANVAVHATEDREHEAAVELLLLVMIVDHHITPCIVLREGNVIAYAFATAKHSAQAVEAECNAAMRRRTVFKSIH